MPREADDLLQTARTAYARHDWETAYATFARAREAAPDHVGADDLNAQADAAWWLGDIDAMLALTEEGHRRYVDAGDTRRAAMTAMDLGLSWMLRGEPTIGSGWLARAERLLQDEPEAVEHGFLLYLGVGTALHTGDLATALDVAERLQEMGSRFDEPTLTSLGLVAEGMVAIRRGELARGMARFDEAILPVVAGTVRPEWAGNIYCEVMAVCSRLSDLERARAWTDATERWCDRFSSAAMFAGICRVHRAQLLQIRGELARAEAEAQRAGRDLATMNVEVAAEAHYQVGEVRRLRGDVAGAAEQYDRAHELGREPQPGLALLRLAQGDVGAAARAIATALAAAPDDPFERVRLRSAQVEVAVAGDDADAATHAAAELEAVASRFASPGFEAAARHARGAAHLLGDDAEAAVAVLRDAHRRWRDLEAPYEAAQVRLLLARSCRMLGDPEAADRELEAAERTFRRLGTTLGLQRVLAARGRRAGVGGLTPREAEILATIADGSTNRQAASVLSISEATVARHLANIYRKLDVPSRTAAVTWAHDQGLV